MIDPLLPPVLLILFLIVLSVTLRLWLKLPRWKVRGALLLTILIFTAFLQLRNYVHGSVRLEELLVSLVIMILVFGTSFMILKKLLP